MKISSTSYHYSVSIANLNYQNLINNLSSGNRSVAAPIGGLAFNYESNGNYCAVILSLNKTSASNNTTQSFEMLVSLVKYDGKYFNELAKITLNEGFSLKDMSIISVNVDENDVFATICTGQKKQSLQASVKRPSEVVQVGYIIGALSSVAVEWSKYSDITIEYHKSASNEKHNNTAAVNNFASLNEEFGSLPTSAETRPIRVWNYNDYIKKVENRQFWDKALMAVAAEVSTLEAGKSTSNTTITTHGSAQGSGYGNASVYGSYGSAIGMYNNNTQASGNATTRISTKSNDALAAAVAQEIAANEFAIYASGLDADAEAINENYLMTTTLDPQTQISGYILLDKEKNKPDIIDLSIPINGVEYRFRLSDIPK